MSILGGILADRGRVVSQAELHRLTLLTERYATGPTAYYASGRLGMSLQPYASHDRSSMDALPTVDMQSNIAIFDGRLDNYRELGTELSISAEAVSDSAIVLSAFRRWGEACFARFTGDWALALWSEAKQQLYLARDHAGARTLYFAKKRNEVLWSTYLDPFVFTGTHRGLSADYVARYLSLLPIRDLTPYEGVQAVLPGQYLIFSDSKVSPRSHWSALVSGAIEYKHDAEYEDHFLTLFRQSVARRTGPGAPILAQLSGGMDSTAIVCMSDHIRRSADADAETLDTISYFDDAEASFDEKTYFSITENRRGKVGTHVDIGFGRRTFKPHDSTVGTYLLPGADDLTFQKECHFRDTVWNRGYRSILSGIGGDEVLGGNPVGVPELADHLVFFRWSCLRRQGIAWSLVDRSPFLFTIARAIAYACEGFCSPRDRHSARPPWVSRTLASHLGHRTAGSSQAFLPRWAAPSRLDNARSWWSVMETLPHVFPQMLGRPEYRYPYLDKDLVEFLFRIPRTQILRPGRRRSLMRRALVKIVPPEILERRRKAFQLRAPLCALREGDAALRDLFDGSSRLAQLGFVDDKELCSSLGRTVHGDSGQGQGLMRAIALELWLRSNDIASTREDAPCAAKAMSLTAG